jgi:hypothetical protein
MGNGRAFVVMQVGSDGSPERRRADEVFDYIITPVLKNFDIEPYRADLDPSPGSVTPKMLKELVEARLVVADLTGKNPNVFYELGITHSFSRPLICIADLATQLPFDAKDERIIQLGEYPESGLPIAKAEKAKDSLTASLRVVLEEGYVPPSPLRNVAANRSLDQLATDDPVAAEIADMREVLDEIRENVTKVRLAIPPAVLEDIGALHALVEDLVPTLDYDRIEALKTSDTSARHDAWVDRVLSDRSEFLRRQPHRDPWSTPAAPSDEPPF